VLLYVIEGDASNVLLAQVRASAGDALIAMRAWLVPAQAIERARADEALALGRRIPLLMEIDGILVHEAPEEGAQTSASPPLVARQGAQSFFQDLQEHFKFYISTRRSMSYLRRSLALIDPESEYILPLADPGANACGKEPEEPEDPGSEYVVYNKKGFAVSTAFRGDMMRRFGIGDYSLKCASDLLLNCPAEPLSFLVVDPTPSLWSEAQLPSSPVLQLHRDAAGEVDLGALCRRLLDIAGMVSTGAPLGSALTQEVHRAQP
jgi:hypothetical protein